MKLQGTNIGESGLLSPFALMMKSYRQTVGAGIGTKRPAWLSDSLSGTVDTARKRRFDNQPLGETPERSGPFSPAAKSVAENMPPKPILLKSAIKRAKRKKGI